ncbi:MAG: DUF5103 domain-containing protein, partial [Bacteroidota bacterium]|nr:DUF5103 domain-containing protein [Bacteroidota bacterium]
RFLIKESRVNIEVENMNNANGGYFYNSQELKITVNNCPISNENINLVVVKNRDWNQVLSKLNISSVLGNKIEYYNPNKLKFKGGSEFHHFNTKDIHYKSENIERIDFIANQYNFLLSTNKETSFSDYFYKKDLNGSYSIDVVNSETPELEADYVNVFFTLQMDAPLQKGEVYVYGKLTNYELSNESKMIYNYEQKAYEASLLLKQGYYNYSYLVKRDKKIDYTFIDGNYSLTENEYLVLVYYKDYSLGYDKLIGVKKFISTTGN